MARYWFGGLVASNLVSNGLITAAALSYGISGMMPKAGGQFVYIQRAYGRLVSLTDGRFYSHSNWCNCCYCSNVCELFGYLFPGLDDVIFTVGNNFTNSKLLAVLVLFC
jgi:APA family basic amino acid/polyamine antiporter